MSLLEKIYDLSPAQSQVLYSGVVDEQLVEVREFEGYRWLQIGGDSIQGLMDTRSPNDILLPNIQALMASLLFCSNPARLLNLGFGCGSIERFFMEKMPGLNLHSLESSKSVIRLAKEFFFISDDTEVINDAAEGFLAKTSSSFDIILCDIFNDEEHSTCLYEAAFYADIFNCISKSGVLAINLLPESEDDVVSILLPMKDYFDHIALLEVPNHFNVIIFASNQRIADTAELETTAERLLSETGLDLTELPQELNRLVEKI